MKEISEEEEEEEGTDEERNNSGKKSIIYLLTAKHLRLILIIGIGKWLSFSCQNFLLLKK